MAARPYWKGYLKLSLVSCPVALYTATTAKEKISFHLINRETGHRLRRQMVDQDSGEVVDSEHQIHGYETAKDDYLLVEDEEIAALAIESTHTIDVAQFVPRHEVSPIYLDTPYYIVPDGEFGEDAFAVIRDSMAKRKMAGIARIVLARREHPLLLEPDGKGLIATTLRYPYEVKPDEDLFASVDQVAVNEEMLDLAGHIIDTKTATFDPSSFHDHYEEALHALIEAKKAGRPVEEAAPPPRPDNVIDLMEALRRSVGDTPAKAGNQKAKSAAPKSAAPKSAAPKSAAPEGAAPKIAAPKKPPARSEAAKSSTTKSSSTKSGAAKPKSAGKASAGKAKAPTEAASSSGSKAGSAKSKPAAARKSAATGAKAASPHKGERQRKAG